MNCHGKDSSPGTRELYLRHEFNHVESVQFWACPLISLNLHSGLYKMKNVITSLNWANTANGNVLAHKMDVNFKYNHHYWHHDFVIKFNGVMDGVRGIVVGLRHLTLYAQYLESHFIPQNHIVPWKFPGSPWTPLGITQVFLVGKHHTGSPGNSTRS